LQEKGIEYSAEYKVDFQLTYDFRFSKDSEDVDAQFTGERAGSFDVDQDGGLSGAFPGGLRFKGAGAGNESYLDALVPATYPFLRQSVQLRTQPEAARRMLAAFAPGSRHGRFGRPEGYGATEAAVQATLDKFPNYTVDWDMKAIGGSTGKQEFALEPGMLVVLEATVEVYPHYTLDIMDKVVGVRKWVLKTVTTSASSRKLDVSQGQEAQVRYVVSLVPAAHAVEEKYAYSANDFLLDAGALAGMLAMGAALLKSIQGGQKLAAVRLKKPWVDESDPEMNPPLKKGDLVQTMLDEFAQRQEARLLAMQAEIHSLQNRLAEKDAEKKGKGKGAGTGGGEVLIPPSPRAHSALPGGGGLAPLKRKDSSPGLARDVLSPFAGGCRDLREL
jgi:hypothetical protein